MIDLQSRINEMPLHGTFHAGLRSALASLAENQGASEYLNLTNRELQALLGVSHNTLDSYIRELVELGLITRTPKAGNTRTAVVASAIAEWKIIGPMNKLDALHNGRPELALAMELSRNMYPAVSPDDKEDWDEIRPEWAVFSTHFVNLLKRYKYDELENVILWALDGFDGGHPYFYGPSKYVKGMRPCALPIDDDDAGERDSWRDFIFYVAVDAPVDDVGGTFRAPAAIMEALSTHLPLMITASGDCDDYYEQRYAAEAAVANREHKRQWGAGNIRRHVHLLGDADEGLAEIVASHENDHLLEPDPDPQNSYTWDYWIHATTPKGEKRLGMSWAPDFMSRYYLIHSIMDGDAGVGFTHLEIRLREAGMDTVLFSGPIW